MIIIILHEFSTEIVTSKNPFVKLIAGRKMLSKGYKLPHIFCGHNYDRVVESLPSFLGREWRVSETGGDKIHGHKYMNHTWTNAKIDQGPNECEWNRPIICILILSDTINQRNASGFYTHSLFRSSLQFLKKNCAVWFQFHWNGIHIQSGRSVR